MPSIDGYRELREIGRGGFSRVYEALQVEFDRLVAIKVLNQPIIDAGHIAEFERECRLMGNLSRHPNIVTVHASAFANDRRPCIVMELFSYGSYQNILNHTGPLSLEELLSLSVLMAGALATAHQRGVIHGDVKPQNIFRSEFNTPALGDFGIAALADAAGDSDKLRASAHYAAPELVEQGPSASSPSADQYSLAATIYTLATGLRPHASDASQSTRELLQRVLVEPAPRLESGFPESLANALHRAMAREPQQRHRDLVAFAAAIARTQQELGFQPTDIPVGAQQARYIAATPQQTASQEPPTGPTPAEGNTESTISLASKDQDPTRSQAGAGGAGGGPPRGGQPPDSGPEDSQPPGGSGPKETRAGGSRRRFPRWARIASVVAIVAAIAIVAVIVFAGGDDGEDGDNIVGPGGTSGPTATEGSETAGPTETAESEPDEPTATEGSETAGPTETAESEPDEPPPSDEPPSGEPSISGDATVGETLEADTSGISDGNGLDEKSFVYQWVRVAPDGGEMTISDQTDSEYVVSDADVGHSIVVKVSFRDQDGHEAGPIASAATPSVPRPNSRVEGGPSIAGTAWVGETLTADTSGISDGNGLDEGSFAFRWVRVAPNDDETTIRGQTGATYVVSNADVGHKIRVGVSFTDQDGYPETTQLSAAVATKDQIVFHSNRNSLYDIFIVNADGSNQRQLTQNVGNNFDPSLSRDGTKIVFTSDRSGNHEIFVMDVDGSNQEQLTDNRFVDGDGAWSPDGTQIVFTTNRYGNYEIAVINADRSSGENARRLTTTSHQDRSPAWSSDGSKIVFIHNYGGDFEIALMNTDGSNVRTLTSNPGDDEAPAWSSDGSKIAYSRGNPDPSRVNDFDIVVMDADGSNTRRILDTSTTEKSPVWSPDDTQIAFHSIRSNRDIEIWVMDATDGSPVSKLIDSPDPGKDWVGSWR